MPDRCDRDVEAGGDFLLVDPVLAQHHHRTEFVQRMKIGALDVFGERVLGFQGFAFADEAGNGRGLRQLLPFDQQLQRPVAPAASRDTVNAGLLAFDVEFREDVDAGEQTTAGDVVDEILNRDAGLERRQPQRRGELVQNMGCAANILGFAAQSLAPNVDYRVDLTQFVISLWPTCSRKPLLC